MMRHLNPQWEISAADVKALLDRREPIVLIDVRQPEEHAHCRIEPAHLFPLPTLLGNAEQVRTLADGRQVITFCHHGHRSVQAAAILREAGLGRVLSMAGGIDAWSREIDERVPRY